MSGLKREPARALRRAAIEALSYTSLAGNNLPALLAGSTAPTPLLEAQLANALSLAEAFATLMMADYGVTFAKLAEAAAELRRARMEALDVWTSVYVAHDNDPRVAAMELAGTPHEAVRVYATAADVTYEEAHYALYRLHALQCETHREFPTTETEKKAPRPFVASAPEGHPGRHGVTVDEDRVHRTPQIGEIDVHHLLLHQAVMADLRMRALPQVLWRDGPLDEIAKHDNEIRKIELQLHVIDRALLTDHEAMVWRIAAVFFAHGEEPMGEHFDYAHAMADEHVVQFFTYLADARREWLELDHELPFTQEMLLDIGRRNPGLAAVANALALGLAQTLVLIRSIQLADEAEQSEMPAAEARPTEDRPQPRTPSWRAPKDETN